MSTVHSLLIIQSIQFTPPTRINAQGLVSGRRMRTRKVFLLQGLQQGSQAILDTAHGRRIGCWRRRKLWHQGRRGRFRRWLLLRPLIAIQQQSLQSRQPRRLFENASRSRILLFLTQKLRNVTVGGRGGRRGSKSRRPPRRGKGIVFLFL